MARNPTRIGRYDLITAIATGGMGRIYLGRATGIGGFERKVVIKTLEVPTTAESDPAIAMFLDEARLIGHLHHQHIASVFEVGRDDDGRYYMVLDYLEGFSAHDVYERAVEYGAALPLDFTLTVVSASANALHYAHTRKATDGTPLGIVHRDVTPSNVMIGYDGAVKMIDFGIAMATDRQTKTQTGFVKGKVGYLSPEQVSGRDVDARTDVFALGIVLYELSTLQRAFRDTSDLATMQRIKQGKFTPPSQIVSDYPAELEAIVVKALQVDPRDRYADADAMRRAVEALGHRLQFVLGDAAVIEVMTQLFEPDAPAAARAQSKVSDPAFEWSDSDHDKTVRRDPEELIAMMRAEAEKAERAGSVKYADSAKQAAVTKPNNDRPRRLRAATEAADALLISADPFATPAAPLPLASPPPTPMVPSVLATPKPVSTRGMAGTPRSMAAAMPPAMFDHVDDIGAMPGASGSMIGANLMKARAARWPAGWWMAVVGLAVLAAAGIGYLIVRESPGAAPVAAPTAPVAAPGSATTKLPPALPTTKPQPSPVATTPVAPTQPTQPAQPPPAPAAARTPVVPVAPPAPPKPTRVSEVRKLPAKVRVQIVTHPPDALVFLDGRKIGKTPFDDSLAGDAGKHVIKLQRKGFALQRLDVTLDADVNQELTLSRR